VARLMTHAQYNLANMLDRSGRAWTEEEITAYGVRVALRGLMQKGYAENGLTLVDQLDGAVSAKYQLTEAGKVALTEERGAAAAWIERHSKRMEAQKAKDAQGRLL
jgi:hypothetical protein